MLDPLDGYDDFTFLSNLPLFACVPDDDAVASREVSLVRECDTGCSKNDNTSEKGPGDHGVYASSSQPFRAVKSGIELGWFFFYSPLGPGGGGPFGRDGQGSTREGTF